LTSPGNPGRLPDERTLIRHLRARLPAQPASLHIGPGDDAAVIVPERGAFQVLTTDVLVEGIHFDRRWSSLADIGHKALAVNLSDLAAMGAAPSHALLSLVLPGDTSLEELDALLDGFLELASAQKVSLAGGNLSRSPGPLMVDVTAVGYVRPRRILTRAGGRPGHGLYVTGTIGGAAAGLGLLRAGRGSPAADGADTPIHRHRRPEPRTRVGMLLGRNRAASACIDLSDGLADAVQQLAEASGTGAVVDVSALPIDAGARSWFEAQGLDPVQAALAGGDDFELLFAVPRKRGGRLRAVQRQARGVTLTRIGELTDPAEGIRLSRDGTELPLTGGFSHF
jgi:thiamine-monophosphate kinase